MTFSVRECLRSSGIADLLRPWVRAARENRRWISSLGKRRNRDRQIQAYLGSAPVKKLQLGASDKILEGWLNSDLEPDPPHSVFLDATRPFPFPDAVLDYVYCEHFIEHIDREQGGFCMREVFRSLKPGGVFRLATPNLLKYAQLLDSRPETSQPGERILRLLKEKLTLPRATPCSVTNHIFYNWGHQFLYTPEELGMALEHAGFSNIQPCKVGESEHEPLRGIERHMLFYGEELNTFETFVLEATKT